MHRASDVSFICILTFNSHRVLWPTLNGAVESAVQKGKLTGLRITIQPSGGQPSLWHTRGQSQVLSMVTESTSDAPSSTLSPSAKFLTYSERLHLTVMAADMTSFCTFPITRSLYFFHSPYYNILKLSIHRSDFVTGLWLSEKRGLAFFLL